MDSQDRDNYISQATLEKILEYIPQLHSRKWDSWDIEMLFKTLYYCALRPMEGINLKKEDFNLEARELFLGKTKTDRKALAAIPKEFVPELERWLNTKDPGRLLKGLSYHPFYIWLKRAGADLEIEAFTKHQNETHEKTVGHIFRKSVGKDMLHGRFGDRAKAIVVIQKHLRHKSSSMTVDNYLKVTHEEVKDAF